MDGARMLWMGGRTSEVGVQNDKDYCIASLPSACVAHEKRESVIRSYNEMINKLGLIF